MLKRGSSDFEKFIPEYNLLIKKFPDFSAEKLIDKYEYLENICVEMTKKIGELEGDKLVLDRGIISMKKDYREKLTEII
jgi:hypothetical protein